MSSPKMQFFDAIALSAVVAELNALGECRIDKVGQPSAQSLYLNLRAGGRNVRLAINLREQWARMHLTREAAPNLPVPSAFTMQLRKHLEGSRLLRVEQPGLERVARLVVAGRDELGDPFERVLVVELIGKYANMFLVDAKDEQLMGCMRPVTEEMCGVRQLASGLPYDPPPIAAGKVDFAQATEGDFLAALSEPGRLVDRLSARLTGLGKVALAQLLAEIGLTPEVETETLEGLDPVLGVLARAQASLRAGRFHPRLENGPLWSYNVWWLGAGEPPPGPGVSEVLEGYYDALERGQILEERRRKLTVTVADLLRKQAARVAGWEATLAKSEGADRERELGDLLTSHMYQLKPGLASIEVTDFYHPEQPTVAVALDPRLTPSENVQRYFKRYQKARNSRQVVLGLLQEGLDETAYLEQVRTAIAQAPSLHDLAEIAEELAALTGKARPAPPARGRRAAVPPAPKPLRYTSSDGLPILVGKNNRQNDHLTFKLARPFDVWLHTQNIPGSHVVILSEGPPPERTLHEAAALAAWHSQARDSSRVPVVHTLRKHVRKPRGAKPGMVIYDQEQTLFVTPTAPTLALDNPAEVVS